MVRRPSNMCHAFLLLSCLNAFIMRKALSVGEVAAVRPRWRLEKRSLASVRLGLVAGLRANPRLFALSQSVDHVPGGVRGEVLIIVVGVPLGAAGVVRHHHHRGVDAAAHALHLSQREHAIVCRSPLLDPQVLLKRLLNLLRAPHHARRGAADHHVILAHRLAVEHGVERGHLVHAHVRHAKNLRDPIHCAHGNPSFILLLGDVEHGNHCGLLVICGVFRHTGIDQFHIVWGEVPRQAFLVELGVAMLVDNNMGVRARLLRGESHAWSPKPSRCDGAR
mmetsp:Transcript_17596/g.29555  ORF Transcript_17596/g.29555 Transcript_17596/m.29555 type:complete len:278 (+) Transcript_17596:454-1287(+)